MKSNLDDDRLVGMGVMTDCILLAFQEDGCGSLRHGSCQGTKIPQECAQSLSLSCWCKPVSSLTQFRWR